MIGAEHLARLMPEYLPRQRWFGADVPVDHIETVAFEVWRDSFPGLVWALVEVTVDDDRRHFQVFVGLRPLDEAAVFLEGKGRWLLGDVTTPEGAALAFDAFVDPELSLEVLARLAPDLSAESVRPLTVEQSNTSLVFDDTWILKVFRRIHAGSNPDVEIATALEREGFAAVPATAAVWQREGADLAVVRAYIGGASDGFDLARTSLRDLLDARVEPSEAGGDFAPEAERLGLLTARLHRSLADAFGSAPADPVQWANELLADLSANPVEDLPSDLVAGVYADLASLPAGEAGYAIRVHGDYHLGQVLRSDEGWYVLDFEGEPTRPLDERRMMSSPLRDVAGMLRSFAYAPEVVLAERGDASETSPELRALGAQWELRNAEAFLDAYLSSGLVDDLVPSVPTARAVVLRSLELGKAVYEAAYEQAHRPAWLHIPLAGVQRLTVDRRGPVPGDGVS